MVHDKSRLEELGYDNDNSRKVQTLDEIAVLTEAIHLLTASIISPDQGTAGYCQDVVDERLEQLQREWKLEETGFTRLHNACMQMKQSNRLTAAEADEAVKDVNIANNMLLNERRRVKNMKLVMKRLCQEIDELRFKNEDIEKKYQECKKENNLIYRSFRKFLKSRQKEEEVVKCKESSDGTESTCTTETSPSLITDDACATLRLEKSEKSRSIFASFFRPRCDSEHCYEISFQSSSTGLQFLPFKMLNFQNTNTDQYTFHVCGFKGFRDEMYKRPKFGARLIGIDDISEQDLSNWTIKELESYLKDKHAPFRMSFRNDNLPQIKMEALKKRSAELRGTDLSFRITG